MTYDELYSQLNQEQKQAVDYLEGPLLILAGPGTGKTQLLSIRTANILRMTDLFPSNILILTYTNAGVKAMRERLAKIIGPNGYDTVVETFHGFANSIITESEEAASIKGERVELTDLERIYLLEYLLDHLEGIGAIRNANAPYLYRNDIQSNISTLKRDGISPENLENFLKTYQPDGEFMEEKKMKRLKAFSIFYKAYEKAKAQKSGIPFLDSRGRYDYDDMIILATEALKQKEDLLAKLQEQFQYVMVDEFQDTNGAQLKFLSTLFPDPSSNICVVGDDDQSIYRFQGASVKNFQIFSEHYLEVKKIILKKNYRSLQPIIEKSTEMIRQIPMNQRVTDKKLEAFRKNNTNEHIRSYQFETIEEELSFIIQEIKHLPQAEWNDTAILVRTRRQAQNVIEAFLQVGLPYSTDGKEDIRGEFRVQELIKILKLAEWNLHLEEKDLLLFEILLSDFWQISHHDLFLFVTYVSQKKSKFIKKEKRHSAKSDREYEQEKIQNSLDFEITRKSSEKIQESSPSLFSELLLRFPNPKRVTAKEHEVPTFDETNRLSIVTELSFHNPTNLHRAAWAISRLCSRAPHFPVFSIIMDFITESGLIPYILKKYENDHVIRLRELRAISSFVDNVKKSNQAYPGIPLQKYIQDLNQLERHEIPLIGEMVSKNQDGIKILTAHGSKGLEFKNVFIPFVIQDLSWPKRKKGSLIPLPHELLIQEKIRNDETTKKLHESDELRLFYVAATRTKDRLIFTSAPQEKYIISRFLSSIGLQPDDKTSLLEEEIIIRFLTKTEQPDPVQTTSEILAGLIQEISLSPSSVNRYLTCPRQFLYHHLLKTPQIKKTSLIYGHCIHKALEKSYRRFIKEDIFPDEKYFEEKFFQELEWQGVDRAMKQSCLAKFEHAKRWYQQTTIQGPIKPFELERKLTKKMPKNLIFTGKFDKVEPLGNSGEVQVVDYKTGEPDKHIKILDTIADIFSPECDDYLRQLIAYKMLYESGYRRRKVKSGQLVFLDPVKKTINKYHLIENTFVSKTIPLSEEMVKNYEKLLFDVWEKINALEFQRLEKYDEKKCGFCPYKGVCWK